MQELPFDNCTAVVKARQNFTPEIDAMMATNLLYWKMEERIEQIDIHPELSKKERHLLIFLGTPMRMGALAQDLKILPSTLTTLADALQSHDLLVRAPDPTDRRALLLQLTPEGIKARNELLACASEIFFDVTGLSPEEIATFSALARKVRDRILADGLPEGLKS
jgi:DNA-binding MarR family transcriptional regulator